VEPNQQGQELRLAGPGNFPSGTTSQSRIRAGNRKSGPEGESGSPDQPARRGVATRTCLPRRGVWAQLVRDYNRPARAAQLILPCQNISDSLHDPTPSVCYARRHFL
jgi:hypothetical protein